MDTVEFDRFYVEEEDFSLYNDLEKDKDFIFSGNSHPNLFLLSACLGYRIGQKLKLNNRKGLTQKTSVLNVDKAEVIMKAFKIIAEKDGEINESNELLVNKVMEEYAKGGFKKLYNVLNEPSSKNENLQFYMIREL